MELIRIVFQSKEDKRPFIVSSPIYYLIAISIFLSNRHLLFDNQKVIHALFCIRQDPQPMIFLKDFSCSGRHKKIQIFFLVNIFFLLLPQFLRAASLFSEKKLDRLRCKFQRLSENDQNFLP